MRILFDLMATQPTKKNTFHGGGEYAKVVFKHLIRNKKDAEIICFYDEGRYFDKDIAKIIKDSQLRLLSVERKTDIQKIISTTKVDKIYSALPYGFYGLNFGDLEFIYTIHGLRAIEMRTDRYEIRYAKNARDIAKYIYKNILKSRYISMKKDQFRKIFQISTNAKLITDSQHSKYSLLNSFPELKAEQIHVLYPPRIKGVPLSDNGKLQDLSLEEKGFFLLINANRWIKNSFRAISAFDKLFSDFPEINKKVLVLGIENGRIFRPIINKDRFVFHWYVEREVLEMLYKSAYCFVYPTLNEGFGYPPLESMKYGTPVIASAINSITEICQDGVIYFNPFSVEEIKNRILQLVFEPGIYERYSQKGIEVSKRLSVLQDQTLDKLIDILLGEDIG